MIDYIFVDHPFVGQDLNATGVKQSISDFLKGKSNEGLRLASMLEGGQWLFARMSEAERGLIS